MAGSPKAGFPARRPGRLFGKKQMVMFGCIVLVLFVAPSLFGIGDTTDSHGLDPDDRGLVRTDFDGDRKHSRRSSWRADASDDLHAGYRMRSDDDLHAGHHGLGSSSWSSSWSSSSSSSSSSRDRHERERDERHERRARERRRHAGHGGLEHDIARRASDLAIPRVMEYVNRELVDPAVRAVERADRVDPNDPSKGHKHGGVGGFFDAIAHPFGIGASDATSDAADPNAYVPAADFGLPHHGKRHHRQKIPAWGEPPAPDGFGARKERIGFHDLVRSDDADDDDDADDARSLRREERIGFHDFVVNDDDDASSGSGSKSGSWFASLFGGSAKADKSDKSGRRERAGWRSTEYESTRGGRAGDDEDVEGEYGGGGRFDDPAPRQRSSLRGS